MMTVVVIDAARMRRRYHGSSSRKSRCYNMWHDLHRAGSQTKRTTRQSQRTCPLNSLYPGITASQALANHPRANEDIQDNNSIPPRDREIHNAEITVPHDASPNTSSTSKKRTPYTFPSSSYAMHKSEIPTHICTSTASDQINEPSNGARKTVAGHAFIRATAAPGSRPSRRRQPSCAARTPW